MNFISNEKLNINKTFNNYYLTPAEDEKLMANVDMEALERGVRKSKEEFAKGLGIDCEKAMSIIHKDVFGEAL